MQWHFYKVALHPQFPDQMLSTKASNHYCWICMSSRQGPGVDGEGLALKDTLRLVCHQVTEHFTSYTTCQRMSGHHARHSDVFEDKAKLTIKEDTQAHFHKA